MIIPTKRLVSLIKLYPTQEGFAKQVGLDNSEVSYLITGKREVSKTMMEALQHYTGWELGDLFEIQADGETS